MRKTTGSDVEQPLTVDVHGLAALLSCGQVTARKIGQEAGAKIVVGRRVLYSVSKIEKYLDELTADQNDHD